MQLEIWSQMSQVLRYRALKCRRSNRPEPKNTSSQVLLYQLSRPISTLPGPLTERSKINWGSRFWMSPFSLRPVWWERRRWYHTWPNSSQTSRYITEEWWTYTVLGTILRIMPFRSADWSSKPNLGSHIWYFSSIALLVIPLGCYFGPLWTGFPQTPSRNTHL